MSIAYQHRVLPNESSSYSALISVATPITDDRGISHAIEHLIFRRSKMFSDPSSLFQLSSLLPLTINASTELDTTHFHCHSASAEVCLTGIQYLLNAICGLVIEPQDIKQELFDGSGGGVINLELAAQQTLISFLGGRFTTEQLLQSDPSNERLTLVGGTQDGISQLGYDDLIDFYSEHYQPGNITMLTACHSKAPQFSTSAQSLLRDIEFRPRIKNISNTQSANAASNANAVKSLQIKSQLLPKEQIKEICWWIDTSKARYQEICESITYGDIEIYILPASNYPNRLGHWPLRLLVKNEAQTSLIAQVEHQIARALNSQKSASSTDERIDCNKFSSDIALLLADYQKRQPKTKPLHNIICCNVRVLAFRPDHRPKYLEASIDIDYPLHKSRLIGPLRIFKPRQEYLLSVTESSAHSAERICIKSNGHFDLSLLAQHIMQTYALDSAVSADCLSVALEHSRLKEFSGEVVKAVTNIGNHSAQLPKLLWQLRDVSDCSAALAPHVQANSDYNEIIISIAKGGDKTDIGFESYGNALHQVFEYNLLPAQHTTAWCLSYILGAYAPLMGRRIAGHCYSIAARFCSYHNRFILFGAFDRNPAELHPHVTNSLMSLIDDCDFITQALPLARLKVESNLKASNAKVDTALENISAQQIIVLARQMIVASKNNNKSGR